MPHPRFQGSTGLGPRGDAIAQFDWSVGKVVEALKENGQYRNTLIILSSDNGPVLFDGYWDGAEQNNGNHKSAGPYRGGKYSAFEGGTRAPLIVTWPERVQPGESKAIVCQVDLMASLAALLGIGALPEGAGSDGQNVLAALLGESAKGRAALVQQGMGSLALRVGNWKFIPPGVVTDRGGIGEWKKTRIGPQGALFNLRDDPGESRNLVSQHPDRAKEMLEKLESETGRSFGRKKN